MNFMIVLGLYLYLYWGSTKPVPRQRSGKFSIQILAKTWTPYWGSTKPVLRKPLA